jgi:MoaA/NifB/PqqE/SkfB family radical SAM enzyme
MLRRSAETIRRVLDVARSRGKKLYLFISLDGIGALHDEIRGVRGAFDAVCRTLDALQALDTPRSQLSMGVSATATRKNIDHLDDVLQFAVRRNLLVSFTFPMSTDVYMNNQDRLERFEADHDLIERFASFLDNLERYPDHVTPPLSFYRSLQATLRGGPREAPCIFRRGGFFLEPNGNVLPCWRSSELSFGSLTDETFPQIWDGPRRRSVLATIEEQFCSSCPSPCYVGFPSQLLEPVPPRKQEP